MYLIVAPPQRRLLLAFQVMFPSKSIISVILGFTERPLSVHHLSTPHSVCCTAAYLAHCAKYSADENDYTIVGKTLCTDTVKWHLINILWLWWYASLIRLRNMVLCVFWLVGWYCDKQWNMCNVFRAVGVRPSHIGVDSSRQLCTSCWQLTPNTCINVHEPFPGHTAISTSGIQLEFFI